MPYHVFRSCLYASWFPGLTSTQYSTKYHFAAGVDGCAASVAATNELKLALVLRACQNIENGCWHSRLVASSTWMCVWRGPYGERKREKLSLDARAPDLFDVFWQGLRGCNLQDRR